MHIDAAVELGQLAVERFFRKRVFADHLSGVAHQHFQKVEFGAGQLQRLVADFRLPFGRVKGNVAGGNAAGVARRIFTALLGAAQNGIDARQKFARLAGFGNVVVGTHFQADDAVDVVAFGGEHDDGDFALRAHGFEYVQTVHFRHHRIQYHHIVGIVQDFLHAFFAVGRTADFQTFGAEIFGQKFGQGIVVVYQ